MMTISVYYMVSISVYYIFTTYITTYLLPHNYYLHYYNTTISVYYMITKSVYYKIYTVLHILSL